MFRDETSLSQQAYWLALLRAPAISNKDRLRLLEFFTTPQEIFKADFDVISNCGLNKRTLSYIQNPAWSKIESDLKWLAQPDHHLLTINTRHYPFLLKQIYDPPICLYVRGDLNVLHNLQISIVGSRRPTADGRKIARKFAYDLAKLGLVITSGLAVGLDSQAHIGALEAAGVTVAVLGSGLDVIYPAKNKDLAERIRENGALISEFPPGFRPIKANFPLRNRIISGLSTGTLVVEAARKSGSLITARCAVEQGREVFAIPGSISNPLSQGCHDLIRQGAKLVDKVDDILEEIYPLASMVTQFDQSNTNDKKTIKGLDERSKLLLDNIGYQPISIDCLVEETNLAVNIVSSLLLGLELKGHIESLPGDEYKRI